MQEEQRTYVHGSYSSGERAVTAAEPYQLTGPLQVAAFANPLRARTSNSTRLEKSRSVRLVERQVGFDKTRDTLYDLGKLQRSARLHEGGSEVAKSGEKVTGSI